MVAAVSGRTGARPWWALLLAGLVGIGAGLETFFMPGLTALALAYVIGFGAYAFVYGVFLLLLGFRLRGRRGEGRGAAIRRAA